MNRGKLPVIISTITVSVIGFLAGFFGPQLFIPYSIPAISTTPPKILPFDSFFNSLYAKAKGEVVAKAADSLTLKNNSQTLLIMIDESNVSSFSYQTASGSSKLTFSQVEVGDSLEGGVSISAQDMVKGHYFNVKKGADQKEK